eukprot:8825974-Pyramimonas_sp.AAC.1
MTDGQARAGVSFWSAPAEALIRWIKESPAAQTPLAGHLLEELERARGQEVELPSFDGGRALTTGRPSTASRTRHRRKTSAARDRCVPGGRLTCPLPSPVVPQSKDQNDIRTGVVYSQGGWSTTR